MGDKSRGPGPPNRAPFWVLSVLLLTCLPRCISSEKNKMYSMDTLCKEYSLQPIYRKVDGAFLKSQNEKRLECTVTFQTHTILQRFLLRFDYLSLDCNDHLFIYDGSHAVGEYKHDLSCANTKTTVGAITTRTNFVTLKYVTDNWGTDDSGFELVITAVKDLQHQCKDLLCHRSPFCISPDLACDGIAHCNDASDEDSLMCSKNDPSLFLGMSLPIWVIMSVIMLLIVAACVVGGRLVCRICPAASQNTPSHTVHQMYSGANGTSKGPVGPVGLAPGGTVLGPVTVNWAHPAALGYLVVLARLYSQAE